MKDNLKVLAVMLIAAITASAALALGVFTTIVLVGIAADLGGYTVEYLMSFKVCEVLVAIMMIVSSMLYGAAGWIYINLPIGRRILLGKRK